MTQYTIDIITLGGYIMAMRGKRSTVRKALLNAICRSCDIRPCGFVPRADDQGDGVIHN